MSEQIVPTPMGSTGPLRTLAVRITEDMRAQLDIIAQLTGRSATEEIRLALESWIDKVKSDPEVLKKAEAVRAEIERDAQTRRNAIASIFSTDTDAKDTTKTVPSSRSTTRRNTKPDGE